MRELLVRRAGKGMDDSTMGYVDSSLEASPLTGSGSGYTAPRGCGGGPWVFRSSVVAGIIPAPLVRTSGRTVKTSLFLKIQPEHTKRLVHLT